MPAPRCTVKDIFSDSKEGGVRLKHSACSNFIESSKRCEMQAKQRVAGIQRNFIFF